MMKQLEVLIRTKEAKMIKDKSKLPSKKESGKAPLVLGGQVINE